MNRPVLVALVAAGIAACGGAESAAEPVSSATATATGAPTAPPTTALPDPSLPVPIGEEWEVVFVDDFNGDELGPVWNTCHWWQTDGGCTIDSNDELQWYRPEAVSLGEGDLRLRASNTPQRTSDGDELPFRSGMVTTGPSSADDDSPSFAFTYGEVSARARFPGSAGTWPALWLLSADKRSLPEIDIVEWYGNEPDVMTSHVHQRIDGERVSQRIEVPVSGLDAEQHVYTVRWLPDRVVFFLDGVETGRVTDPALVPSTPMYLVANLALGGPAGPVDPDALPVTFRIDEIVVSQWSAS